MMFKRILAFVLSLFMALSLGGCWNYRGLDQMDIVVGIAVDFDKETSKYKVSYEIVDLMGASKDGGPEGIIIESEGDTLFDAARNAKRKESDRLFFGSAYIVVISKEVAQEMGVSHVLEWFLRDGECRETMHVAVSQEDTARVILESCENATGIMSVIIHEIIVEDSDVTSSAVSRMLFEIFDDINSTKDSAMLTALYKTQSGEREVSELNGTAICKGDMLVGFLSADESRYALLVVDQLKGGIFTISVAGLQTDDISLEIFQNTTKNSYTYEQGKVKVRIETDTRVALAENHSHIDAMNEDFIKCIEETAARMIEKNIADVVARVQNEFGADVFGFGEMIYKRDLPLWRQLEDSWDELFPLVEVEVISQVHVVNSGFIR